MHSVPGTLLDDSMWKVHRILGGGGGSILGRPSDDWHTQLSAEGDLVLTVESVWKVSAFWSPWDLGSLWWGDSIR